MSDDRHPDAQTLRDGWDAFCDGLKRAADLVFEDPAPDTELDRVAGIRYISQYITHALEEWLEFNDPLFPQLRLLQRPTNKNFGDNPDCTYFGAWIDGTQTYRVVGNRGTAKWVRFGIHDLGEHTSWRPLSQDAPVLANGDLQTEWDGSFVVTLSPDPHPGNWMKTDPGTWRLMIRQFFGNWDTEQPMTARIERVGADGEVPSPLSAEGLVGALRRATEFIRADSRTWQDYIEFFRPTANTFVPGFPTWLPVRESAVGRMLHHCCYTVRPDEALLIEFVPPPSFMWVVELDNYWMTSSDYRYHLSSLNSSQVVLEDDGSVKIAVSSTDPGLANWLDPAGHQMGLIICRWIIDAPLDDNPSPRTRVVKLTELPEMIPEAKRRTREERVKQLTQLKIGADRRFGTY